MPPPSSLTAIPITTGPLPSESGPLPSAHSSAMGPGPSAVSQAAHSSATGPVPMAGLPSVAGDLSAEARSAPSVAAAMCNLLSVGGDSQSAKLPGLYVGEGLPPVPVKLVEKIHKWEFVEMSELLPEY